MRNLGLAEVARFLGVAQPARDVAFNGVSTDSRSITAGQLFVALSGERFDGHAFAGEAERRGAAALLTEVGEGEEAGPTLPGDMPEVSRPRPNH